MESERGVTPAPATTLEAFFAEMRPFLLGQQPASQLSAALGPCDLDDLAYYRTLIDRNYHKILRDLYGQVRAALLRAFADDGAERWTQLVRAFALAHPCRNHDPNEFGRPFSDFLTARMQSSDGAGDGAGDELPAALDELADYHWIRHRAHTAGARSQNPDGLDQRVFVRMYSDHVPNWFNALRNDEAWAPGQGATTVIVYRDLRDQRVKTFYPTLPALQALARRQGIEASASLAKATPPHDDIERQLVRVGILPSARVTPPL